MGARTSSLIFYDNAQASQNILYSTTAPEHLYKTNGEKSLTEDDNQGY